MAAQVLGLYITVIIILLDESEAMEIREKQQLKTKVVEMFNHAYGNYMEHAFPADELMPLSCRGRYRGSEPSRGDIDDSLGNFTLTLVDTLDTLAVLGDIQAFEKAVKLIINQTKFDSDVIVSVFETNIRVLGGLLGGHVITTYLKRKKYAMEWYKDELLLMAKDIGNRLLPAFNTTTGIPYPRINLKHGIDQFISRNYKDTCTACAGTMILEFAALSRLTGDSVYEDKARKAMDYLWTQRHRSSDLVGTVINIHNGDWIRRESGVGAGIDSYYEYVLKAYILLGDDSYLDRFNKHYAAVMKYISQGPLLVDVHMHRPHSPSRHFMDALLAFWPGLQVLKGDIQPAIETHEMLYQVMKKHNFLPEAFTTDFRVHWGQSLLRPEFVESTYFLYKATGDPYYLEVGKLVIDNLNNLARVPCGFAAIKDVTKGTHDDQLDSFVLAETFKYLYLLFAEKADMIIDIDDYIFTTEAHLLPLTLSLCNNTQDQPESLQRDLYNNPESEDTDDMAEEGDHNTCPNPQYKYKQSMNYAQNLRHQLKDIVEKKALSSGHSNQLHCPSGSKIPRLRASEFVAGNNDHLQRLRTMGIQLVTMTDGRIQLLHTASEAESPSLAEEGLVFMQEMIELSKTQQQTATTHEPMWIQLVARPYDEVKHFRAGPAQFGHNLKTQKHVSGFLVKADPYKSCGPINNQLQLQGKIAILERGNCMFIDKARQLQKAGALGGIVIDHTEGSSGETQPLFAMSGDGQNDVTIPLVFLFHKEGSELLEFLEQNPSLVAVLTATAPDDTEEISSPPPPSSSSETAEAAGPDKTSESSQKPHDPVPTWTKTRPPRIRTLELHPLEQVDNTGSYVLKTGTQKVQVEVDIETHTSLPKSPAAVSEDVISFVTLEDGSKQLMFRFDKLRRQDSDQPLLTEIYEGLLKVLLGRTNFPTLKKQDEYLIAIAKLLENSYFSLGSMDLKSQLLFDELAKELEIYPEDWEGISEESEIIHDSTEHAQDKPVEDEHPHEDYQYISHSSDSVRRPGVVVSLQSVKVTEKSHSYASAEDFDEEIVEVEESELKKGRSRKDDKEVELTEEVAEFNIDEERSGDDVEKGEEKEYKEKIDERDDKRGSDTSYNSMETHSAVTDLEESTYEQIVSEDNVEAEAMNEGNRFQQSQSDPGEGQFENKKSGGNELENGAHSDLDVSSSSSHSQTVDSSQSQAAKERRHGEL